ncbi:unnamed protein product [Sphagnum balticum]
MDDSNSQEEYDDMFGDYANVIATPPALYEDISPPPALYTPPPINMAGDMNIVLNGGAGGGGMQPSAPQFAANEPALQYMLNGHGGGNGGDSVQPSAQQFEADDLAFPYIGDMNVMLNGRGGGVGGNGGGNGGGVQPSAPLPILASAPAFRYIGDMTAANGGELLFNTHHIAVTHLAVPLFLSPPANATPVSMYRTATTSNGRRRAVCGRAHRGGRMYSRTASTNRGRTCTVSCAVHTEVSLRWEIEMFICRLQSSIDRPSPQRADEHPSTSTRADERSMSVRVDEESELE